MIKKIGLITLFILFAGVLIYGAVNRTTAKSETASGRSETQNLAANERHANDEEAQSLSSQESFGQQNGQGNQGQGQGQGQGQSNQGQGQGQSQGSQGQSNQGQGQGQGQGSQGQSNQGQGQGQGQGNQGQGQGRNQQRETAEILELSDITGVVVQAPALGVDMILETAEDEVLIGTGPGYLAEQGFVVLVGDSVSVTGTWEDEEFKAVEITHLADGTSIVLRDEWGRPMWSGAGRRAIERQSDQNGV